MVRRCVATTAVAVRIVADIVADVDIVAVVDMIAVACIDDVGCSDLIEVCPS